MRARTFLAASGATAALVLGAASPVSAGISAIVELDPNPAQVGDTVTATPISGCPDFEAGRPEVLIEITGPVDSSFTIDADKLANFDYPWTADFTAGPVGVYTVQATCIYSPPQVDTAPQARQQVPTFAYAPATLQVIGPDEPEESTTTTAAPSTTSTTAAAATPTTNPAPPATAVAASPRYTG